jgi:hypothetical protein
MRGHAHQRLATGVTMRAEPVSSVKRTWKSRHLPPFFQVTRPSKFQYFDPI